MHFVWDEKKSRRNLRKHKISFETAKLAFEDPLALSVQDRVVEGEQRWQTIGLVADSVVVLVAHTIEEDDTEDVIRIISARKATPHERRTYESQGKKPD